MGSETNDTELPPGWLRHELNAARQELEHLAKVYPWAQAILDMDKDEIGGGDG